MNDATLLLRQIHPAFVQDGRVSSQAFRPTPKDAHRLSAYDGDRIESQAAFFHYTVTLGLLSVGVMAVTQSECAGLELPVYPDSVPFPEQVLSIFRPLVKAPWRKKPNSCGPRPKCEIGFIESLSCGIDDKGFPKGLARLEI